MDRKIAIVGLGYVGFPLALEFGKLEQVIGFDIDEAKINSLKKGIDPMGEFSDLEKSDIFYTSDPSELRNSNFTIIAVPTPVDKNNIPNLSYLITASSIVGENLAKNSIVVYESTVYPGATEEECIPVLEEKSGLKCGIDFKVGYSPERVNPGDDMHTIDKVVKIVSGIDQKSLDEIVVQYERIVKKGVYRASNIKTAEAAKVIENIQRDLNIALMNELSIIFNKLGIDTKEVIDAASTKWNFLKFVPGLVGGHCIGVDPYYLTAKAQSKDYNPEVILAGRKINNSMSKYVAEETVKALIQSEKRIKNSNILIMGATFKENIKDFRNSKVENLVIELKSYGIDITIYDPMIEQREIFGAPNMTSINSIGEMDAIILAVPHKQFYEISLDELRAKTDLLIDLKWMYDKKEIISKGFNYFRL